MDIPCKTNAGTGPRQRRRGVIGASLRPSTSRAAHVRFYDETGTLDLRKPQRTAWYAERNAHNTPLPGAFWLKRKALAEA